MIKTDILMYIIYIMKIPNYDKNRKEDKKRSLNNFLDEDFRMLICGKSNCGKTCVCMHILRSPLAIYDKIIFYTPNRHQDKIKDLELLMNDISKRLDTMCWRLNLLMK